MKIGVVVVLSVLALLILGSLVVSAIALVMKVVFVAVILGILWLFVRRGRRSNQ